MSRYAGKEQLDKHFVAGFFRLMMVKQGKDDSVELFPLENLLFIKILKKDQTIWLLSKIMILAFVASN